MPYAVGGAIALGYYGEPRGTIDIDLNVFVTVDRAREVLHALSSLGLTFSEKEAIAEVEGKGQTTVRWEPHVVDLFFINHRFHRECASRVREVPFGDDRIMILSAEDLLLFKIAFNRRKDWLDIEQVLFSMAGSLDLNYLRKWCRTFFDSADARNVDLESTIERILGADA